MAGFDQCLSIPAILSIVCVTCVILSIISVLRTLSYHRSGGNIILENDLPLIFFCICLYNLKKSRLLD